MMRVNWRSSCNFLSFREFSAFMARTKIVVTAAALGQRKKPFHVNVAGSTTSAEVVGKVLEKSQCRDPPLRYQLWAVAADRGEDITALPYFIRVWIHCELCLKGREIIFKLAFTARLHVHVQL